MERRHRPARPADRPRVLVHAPRGGEQDYAKNQRILQTVKGAWADAEQRLAWSPLIKPNTAPKDDQRLYGVQWGTVWDTIAYTTGSLGDWINSPLGLDGDGIDNEMSLSHISNCGVGSCYLVDAEQLHVDGNKSLVYSMVNFTLQPEDTTFRVPGSIAYVRSPKLRERGHAARLPGRRPAAQAPILDAARHRERLHLRVHDPGLRRGRLQRRRRGQGHGRQRRRRRPARDDRPDPRALPLGEEDPGPATACGEAGDAWEEINRYFDQAAPTAGRRGRARQPAAARPLSHLPDRGRREAGGERRLRRSRHRVLRREGLGAPASCRTRRRT